MNPLVSVVIPAYRCREYLERSVMSVVGQTVADLEILIIEDCSGDGTLELAHSLAERDSRARVLANEKNMGVARSRNHGIDNAKGEYIAFLDADDLWTCNKLEMQLEALKKTGRDLCYTAYAMIDEKDNFLPRPPYHVPKYTDLRHMLGENVIGCSTVLFRKSIADGARMRPEYAHEDYAFWLELMGRGAKVVGVDEVLMHYRITQSNRSANKWKAAANRWRIYRDFLKMGLPSSCFYLARYAWNSIIKRRRRQ